MNDSVFRTIGLLFFAAIVAIGMAAAPAMALNMVVIAAKGKDAKPMKNVITVAKEDGDFTSLAAAMASITDASSSNKYLIVIGPGTYEIDATVHMKDWVSIAGSGRNLTTLYRHVGGSGDWLNSAVLELASHSTVSDLYIHAVGSGTEDVLGIVADNCVYTQLSNIEVFVFGSTVRNYGLVYYGSEDNYYHYIDNVKVKAGPGASYVTAVYLNSTGDVFIRNSHVSAYEGTNSTFGILIKNSCINIFIDQVKYDVRDDSTATGITSVVQLEGNSRSIRINDMGEIFIHLPDYGVYAENGCSFRLKNSYMMGSAAAVRMGSSNDRLINNTLWGGIENDQAGAQCKDNYDTSLNNVDC